MIRTQRQVEVAFEYAFVFAILVWALSGQNIVLFVFVFLIVFALVLAYFADQLPEVLEVILDHFP